jgi:ATPase family associated with various cellular activities (AAA)
MIETETYFERNRRGLMNALGGVRLALEAYIARLNGETPDQVPPNEVAPSPTESPQLENLIMAFKLSRFERDVLLLCAGVELDTQIPALCVAAHGDPARGYASFSLALAALPNAHWDAIGPFSPLRRWRLVEIQPGSTMTQSALKIDERILNYMAGASHVDMRLSNLLETVQETELVLSQQALAERIVVAWSRAQRGLQLPAVQITAIASGSARAVIAHACERLGLKLAALPASLVPTEPAELETLARLWEREVALAKGALFLDCFALENSEVRSAAVNRLIERIGGPLVIAGRERRRDLARATLNFDVRKPDVHEQRQVWHSALGPDLEDTANALTDPLVAQFNLDAGRIRAVADEALAWADDPDLERGKPLALARALWDAARLNARPTLEGLAQRIDGASGWDDLVLPFAQREVLSDIAKHVRHRGTVYERWGFGGRNPRGLGITALFAGASGTGKTTAAEVLSKELELDVYRIDLSSTVSKYIGETEKNLARIFDAAEEGGAILLFDEADALFGKRSEVKDSHDRYANLEISYLLQRMEQYSGLAILTTNIKSALDTAFMRRIRFVVQFPFPDPAQREEIWRRVYPKNAPTDGLDYAKLAQLNVSGGSIRNIALSSAFLAADDDAPIQMHHVLQAAHAEYAKQEKVITQAEVRGWLEDE